MKRYTKTTTTKPNRIFLPLEYEIKISQSAKITNLSPETRCHLLLQTKGNKSEPKDPTLTHTQLHKKKDTPATNKPIKKRQLKHTIKSLKI